MKRAKSLINSEILTKCVNSRIDGLEIATITKNIFSQKARTDLASATHLLQAAVVNIGKAKKVLRHRHLPKNRKIDRTEEMWIILRGKFEAKIFDVDNSQLLTVELSRGSLLHLHRGGHELISKSRFSKFLEIKNGPYLGSENDRIYF